MKYFIPLAIVAGLCLFFMFNLRQETYVDYPNLVGQPLPSLTANGQSVNERVQQKLAVINLFASWCAPCALEQPALMQLQEEKLAFMLGIAWKTTPEQLDQWYVKYDNPYNESMVDLGGELTLPLGMTGVPETLVVDRQGIVRFHTRQPITEHVLDDELIPLLKTLASQ